MRCELAALHKCRQRMISEVSLRVTLWAWQRGCKVGLGAYFFVRGPLHNVRTYYLLFAV